jgi:hypothetical protein
VLTGRAAGAGVGGVADGWVAGLVAVPWLAAAGLGAGGVALASARASGSLSDISVS